MVKHADLNDQYKDIRNTDLGTRRIETSVLQVYVNLTWR
jgi:hypothetical protein